MKKLIVIAGAAVGLSLGALALPAAAQTRLAIDVLPSAPSAHYELLQIAHRDRVWVPDGYQWRHGRRHFVRGHWIAAPARYDHRRADVRGPHGDRDRDGVPNRFDRDRDGDGVRNRFDNRPNNPQRY